MKQKLLLFLSICPFLLLAPPEGAEMDPTSFTTTSKQPSYITREELYQRDKSGFNSLEKAFKNRDLESAKQILTQAKKSGIPLETALQPLFERYNNSNGVKLTDIYSGKSMDDARTQLVKDLKTVSPHTAKSFRDLFTQFKVIEPQARNDQAYFDWLDQNPDRILHPAALHEKTPFEIAVATDSPEMAQGIIKLAKKHKISAQNLVEPLVNEYINIMNTKGETAAHEFVSKVYNLKIDRISKVFFDEIQDIQFSAPKVKKVSKK